MQSLFHPLEDTLRPTNVGQIPPLLDPVDETVGSSVFLSVPSNGTRRPPNGDTSFSSTKGEIEHHSHRSTFSKANSTWSDWMNGVSPPSSPDIRENTPATPSKAARQAQRSKSIVQWLSNGSLTQLPTRSKSVVESVPWRSEDPPQIQGVFESMPNVQGRFDSSAELPVRRKEGRPDRQILGGPAAWRSTSFASPKPMSLFEIDPETEHYLYEDVPDPYDEDEGAGLNDLPLDDSLFRRFSHPDIGHDSVQFDEIDAFEARLNTGRNNKQEPSPDVPRVFRNSAFQPFRKPTRGYSVPLVVVTDSPERRPEHDDAPNFQFFPEKRVVVMEPEEVGERAAPFARGNQQPKGIQAVHLAHITNAGSLTANSMSSLLNPKHDSVALPIGFLAPLHSESPESAAGESSQVPVSRSCSLHLPVLTLAELSSEAVCASPVSSRCSSSPDDEEAQKIRSALPRLGFSVDSSSDPHAKDTAVLHHPSLASRYAPHEDSVSRRLSTPQVRFLTTSTVMEFQPMQHLAIGQPVLPDSRTAEYDSKVKESDATLNATSGVASACFEVEQEPVSRTEQNSLAVPLAVPLSLHTSNKESGSAATTGCDGSSRRQRSLASSPQSEVDSAQFLTAIDVNTYPLFGAPLISSSRAPTVGTGSTRGSIATAKTRKGELLPQHHRSPSSSSREPVAHGPERQEQQSIYSEARSRVESIATSISKNGSPVKPIHPSIAAGRDKSPRPQSTTSRRASGPPAGTGGAGAKRPTRPRWPIGTLPKRMMSSATDTESRVILDDGASMPVNQFYASVSKRSPPFRSLPKGFPVSPWTVAVVCLVITCASTLANLSATARARSITGGVTWKQRKGIATSASQCISSHYGAGTG
ncbi:hypothetical protein DFJ73DRAFT_40818 [Zopfochytrium polystomum]|nr:hypothetical protein DFJ73DRAFT_40818 [Zopfochytrium polystomum]